MPLKIILPLSLFFVLMSCDKTKTTYYENGKLKSIYKLNSFGKKEGLEKIFYPNGQILSLINYENGVWIDSIVKFDKDKAIASILKKDNGVFVLKNFTKGVVDSEGKVDSLLRPIGWWLFYKNHKVYKTEEKIIVENQSITNRRNIYQDGKIDSIRSDFYTLAVPSAMIKDKQYSFKLKYHFDETGEDKNLLSKTYYFLMMSNAINDDFSNLNRITLDTFVPIQKGEFIYNLGFRTVGEKKIRGIIEKSTMVNKNGKLIITKSRLFINEKLKIALQPLE